MQYCFSFSSAGACIPQSVKTIWNITNAASFYHMPVMAQLPRFIKKKKIGQDPEMILVYQIPESNSLPVIKPCGRN